MSRFKWAVLGVFAMLVVSAVASASASASVESRYFVEGTELTTAETVDGAVGVAQLNGLIAGAKTMIECTANELSQTGENTIEKEGKSKTEILYKQCYVYTITGKGAGIRELVTGCGVSEPIRFSALDQLFASTASGTVEDEFKPAVGNKFIEITLVNANGKTCVLKGTFPVEGSYIASGGDENERSLTEHELVFTSTGSKVIFNKEPAYYTNTVSRLKLRSGKSFQT